MTGAESGEGETDRAINREPSWVEFDRRVLDEALDSRHTLPERITFLSIFASNLDESFMIRVAGLRRQLAESLVEAPPGGASPGEQLAAIRAALAPLQATHRCWADDLCPRLDAAGIGIRRVAELDPAMRDAVVHRILLVHLRDTAQARLLQPHGTYVRAGPEGGEAPFDMQAWMLDHRGAWWSPRAAWSEIVPAPRTRPEGASW